MLERDMKSRISVLESNQETLNTAVISMSKDIRDIRDVIIGSNLSELPKRVANLEKSRWIGHGAAGAIGGGAGLGIAKLLSFIGAFAK